MNLSTLLQLLGVIISTVAIVFIIVKLKKSNSSQTKQILTLAGAILNLLSGSLTNLEAQAIAKVIINVINYFATSNIYKTQQDLELATISQIKMDITELNLKVKLTDDQIKSIVEIAFIIIE